MKKRRNRDAGFRARVALEAVKGEPVGRNEVPPVVALAGVVLP